MIKCLIALIALFPAAVSAAPVWTWVDEQGRRHYSDREVPGAVQFEVGETQTFSGSALSLGSPATTAPPETAGDDPAAALYTVLDIVRPEPEETLRNIEGNLIVELATYPALSAEHRIDLILDGQRRNLNARALRFPVPEVFRGEHTLQVVIIDQAGAVVQRSSMVRFFVQQTSAILSPAMQGSGAPPPASNSGAAGSQ
jgi:hypothetical protein